MEDRRAADGEMGRTLILGATSLVGRFLTPRLIAAGVRPVVVSRKGEPLFEHVDWIVGDLGDPKLGVGLPTFSTLLSLSPIWLLPQSLPALIARGASRVVAFSSTSRFTKISSPVAAERAMAAKLADSEAMTIALCEAAGVSWTILRPTLIYAEGLDGNVSRLAALIRRLAVLPLAGAGGGLRQPVHADDLAAAALNAATASAAHNQAYDLPGGEMLTYYVMVQRVFEGLSRKPLIVQVPAFLWSLAFALAKPFLPGATAAMGARMNDDLIFDARLAQRDLCWAPRDFHPDFRGPKAST